VLVACRRCVPGSVVWRCARCYNKLKIGIEQRIPKLSTACVEAIVRPELRALLDIDWKALGPGPTTLPASSMLDFDLELGAWCWRGACASCYDFEVEPVHACMPHGFATLMPQVVSDVVLDILTPTMHPRSGLVEGLSPCRVRVVTMAAVITHKESMLALFRLADDKEHGNYKLLWQPPPRAEDGRPRWLLVRGVAAGEEPKLLSLIAFDALCCGRAERRDHEVASALLDCTRRAAPWHKSGATQATLMQSASNAVEHHSNAL